MKLSILRNVFASMSLIICGSSPGQAEERQDWRLGLRFDQLEQTRQAVTVTHQFFIPSVYVGLLVGNQGFREVDERQKNRMRSTTDAAAILQAETLVSDMFMLATQFSLGWRDLPKTTEGKNADHTYFAFEETLGLKQGSVFLFVGAGYRSNFIRPLDPPSLGGKEVPTSFVYPTLGFDIRL